MTDSFSIAIVTERIAFMNRLRFLRLEFPVKKRTQGGKQRKVKAKGKKTDRGVDFLALSFRECRQNVIFIFLGLLVFSGVEISLLSAE